VAGIGMAAALEARDDVDVVGVAAHHRRPPAPAWEPPIPVHQLPLPRVLLYEAWHRVRRPRVDLATGPVDVIHATTLAIPPKSAALVVTIHDLAFLNDATHFTKRGLAFFRRGLDLAMNEADLVMCPSTATLEHCRAHGFAGERLRLVPMGVDVAPATDAAIAAARVRYNLDRPYVMWTGTIEPRKNLPRLIEAFAELDRDDVDLVLVGPKGWKEDLDPLVRRRPGRVKLLGFVPLRDLAPIYAGAEVFCFPSLFEGFGLPVLEAMSQGTAVVTSRGTSTEEIAGDAAVLVDPADAGDIARGVRELLDDDEARKRLEDAGAARAREYSWDRTAELVAACYREVAA